MGWLGLLGSWLRVRVGARFSPSPEEGRERQGLLVALGPLGHRVQAAGSPGRGNLGTRGPIVRRTVRRVLLCGDYPSPRSYGQSILRQGLLRRTREALVL